MGGTFHGHRTALCSTALLCSPLDLANLAALALQVFCVGLWCMDAFWDYSLFTLGMLVLFECTVVIQRRRALTDLRAIQSAKPKLQARQPCF